MKTKLIAYKVVKIGCVEIYQLAGEDFSFEVVVLTDKTKQSYLFHDASQAMEKFLELTKEN